MFGGVEEVDPGVQAHVHLPPRPGDVRGADLAEATLPPEGHRAEGQAGDVQTRASETTILHRILPTWLND